MENGPLTIRRFLKRVGKFRDEIHCGRGGDLSEKINPLQVYLGNRLYTTLRRFETFARLTNLTHQATRHDISIQGLLLLPLVE